jgi:hypothetical protein
MIQACATGETAGGAQPREKGAVSGREGQIDFWYSVAPDCTSTGYAEVRVLTPPSHGALRVTRGEDFPDFSKDNVRQVCNSRKLPVTFVYYQATPGFTGIDTAVIEVLFPSGNVRSAAYSINVRP